MISLKKQHFCSFALAGVNLTDFGLKVPSPFAGLTLSNSEITSATQWTLRCVIGGDESKKANIAAFEALLYSSAQAAASYADSAGIPVSFVFGWLDEQGNVAEHVSYQGWTIQFQVSMSGSYMVYDLTGYASTAVQSNMPVLRIPALTGFVQPSAVVEALAKSAKVTSYYELDIDHNDVPTLISHGALTTSFNRYVRGEIRSEDDFDSFPGLLPLSKSWNSSRDAAGLAYPYKKLSQVINNRLVTPTMNFLKKSLTDTAPQASSFSFWVEEPTMTRPGVIHYKSNAGLTTNQLSNVLQYGTAETNVLSIQGKYDGVAYNMSDMNFKQVGFDVDGSGNTILDDAEVVNSWSNSLADVYQSANIINDINAIASQFSGDFTITVPGQTSTFEIAQPVSVIVMVGNTLSPISGIYNIMNVSHNIEATFTTALKLKRLQLGSANQVATSQNIFISGSGTYPDNTYSTTKNVISPYKVDFGNMFPTYEHMWTGSQMQYY